MYYHMIAFLAGFLLDLLIGDPHWLYHPGAPDRKSDRSVGS